VLPDRGPRWPAQSRLQHQRLVHWPNDKARPDKYGTGPATSSDRAGQQLGSQSQRGACQGDINRPELVEEAQCYVPLTTS